ncbi:hypothetical protein [Ulvibacter litoralis]|uniref:Curlin associated repeat-containing protein n=1 Tax=Ulvibacter litoralis TaxID=227084 RepID=A0A1G7GNL7_9FLAO|nr:hypothetical protein [Ulvibacter litoralis]SDE89589.1 Curlin associated repeat-containing protein [Ulvibacter litoralis]
MKHLFLCACTFLFSALSFSQSSGGENVSNSTQTGTNNATVNQTALGTYVNFSDLLQTGTNLATVNQYGANSSLITQTGSNWSTVNQNGGDGHWTGFDITQTSDIVQNGVLNRAFIEQLGDGQSSIVSQDNDIGDTKGSKADIKQYGLNNTSDVVQIDDANYALVVQDGDHNVSDTDQQTYDVAVPVHASLFLQGNLVNQTGSYNFSKVEQYGDNQRSDVTQEALGGGVAADPYTNEANVLQNGEMNWSIINQSDTVGVDANNSASVTETNLVGGPGNLSTVNQFGANSINVNQTNF